MKSPLPKFNLESFAPSNVNLKVLGKPKIVNTALKSSSPLTKAVVILFIALTIAGLITSIFGVYLVATKDIADPKSEINEAVVLGFNHLNPLFSSKNSVEERITNMLYTPLYQVDYSKFGTSNSAKINTNYLVEKLTWSENKPEQVLNIRLKDNLTFSDGTRLTTDDVKYTFDTIKTLKQGNKNYKKTFEDLKLNTINDLEFEVVSDKPRASMMYDLDFSPVSKKYMETVPLENLLESEQTKKPMVTTGTYKISQSQVQDKDYSDKVQSPNPISSSDTIQFIKLEAFKSKNSRFQASTQTWNIKKYDTVLSNNISQKRLSVESDAKLNKVDLFIRQYEENPIAYDKSQDIKKSLALKQDIIDNNWYFSTYFNTKTDVSRSKPGTKVEFRNYASCLLTNSNLNSDYFSPVAKDKKVLPISMTQTSNPDCSKELKEPNYKLNEEQYLQFNNADPNLVFKILYVGFDNDIEKYLVNIFENNKNGKIKTELTSLTKDTPEVKDAFTNSEKLGKYDLIVYPTQIRSLKNNPELVKSNTILIGSSEDTIKLEELNNLYNDKNFNQKESEDLAKFFTEKSLIANLYNYKTEINHNFKKPVTLGRNGTIGYEFNNWYNKTVKEWFFK
jgi:hypothetical protein